MPNLRPTILLLFLASALPAQDASFFASEVAPILAAKCLGCHAGSVKMGGLALDTFEALETGGNRGKIVVPGKSAESRLYLMVTGDVEPAMPFGGERLPPEQIARIKKWIDEGAAPPNAGEITTLAPAAGPTVKKIEPKVAVKPQIFSLTYSPDGSKLALGGYQQVRLVDPATGKTTLTLSGLADVARATAFSKDGRLLAAGGGPPGRGGEVKIFDVASGKLQRTIEGHADTIYAVTFSPDGKLLATSSYDKLIKLWDVESGQELRTLKDHIDAVFDLAFTPDGKRLISGSADRSVKIWDPATGERLFTLGEPLDGINSIAVHPSGKRVAAGGLDRTIRIWELGETGGKLLASLIAHQAAILRVAYSPDGNLLVSTSSDRTVKVFHAEDLTELKTLPNQPDWVMSLQFAPDGSGFAAGRFDGSLSIYETTSYKDRLELLSAAR